MKDEAQEIEFIDSPISFELKRMEDLYKRSNRSIEKAHRHNYYTVLLVDQASGTHKIDFDIYDFDTNQVFFVSPGQVHQVIEEKEPKGFVILFSDDFLVKNSIDQNFIKDINLFHDYGNSPPLKLNNNTYSELESILCEIEDLINKNEDLLYDAIGAYLKLFLIKCHNACDLNDEGNTQKNQAGLNILRDFKTLVEKNFNKKHKVNFYANSLYVSPDHLNKTIKLFTGVTAKEYIQSRITTEAKRMLLFTQNSSKEISYQLGFNDPSHFSSFFKKCTNLSISEFKKSNS